MHDPIMPVFNLKEVVTVKNTGATRLRKRFKRKDFERLEDKELKVLRRWCDEIMIDRKRGLK